MNHTNFIAKPFLAALAGTLILTGCGCSGGGEAAGTTGETGTEKKEAITLMGAGSTFVNPAMSAWSAAYAKDHPEVTINYQSVGSGAGIAQYKQGTVDFGATDAPLSDKEGAEMPTPTLNVPIASGAVVLAYNIPSVTGELKLTPATLAGIFLGTIKTWNDPKLMADNADLKLPPTAITVCHRADGSGTSYIFTDYLTAVSPEWSKGPGKGKTVNWPVGLGGKGNDGVAGLIKQTTGGIGYIELAYAVQTKMPYAQLKNAAGSFVKATPESTSAAAEGYAAELAKDIRTSIVNSKAPTAYPLAGFTYVLVSQKPTDAAKAKSVQDFLRWAMTDGQSMVTDLQYAPLAKSVVDLNTKTLDGIESATK